MTGRAAVVELWNRLQESADKFGQRFHRFDVAAKILNAARIGTARMTPTIPHIQPQKVSESSTSTGLSVSERPITKGVMKFPSKEARMK